MLQRLLANPDTTIDQVSRAIQTGRTYPAMPVGTMADEQIVVRERTYHYALSVPLTYQPGKGYGLVVCLHGAGFSGDAYLERWQHRLGDDYLLVCPTYPSGAWFTRQAEDLVLAVIERVQAQYHVDPDRVFLTGMSNGGIGTWLIGMHHAQRFAGLAPMASGLDSVLLPFLANLRTTPVYIIHGAKDQVMPVELSRTISRELAAIGYPHIYREHEREHPMAGGHFFPREELPDLVSWFNAQHRTPVPTALTVIREASHFQPFGWVRIDATDPIAAFADDLVSKRDELTRKKRYARLDVSVAAPNRIEVETGLVQRYTLFLNDQLVDVSKPVTVVTNKQVSFEGMVTSTVETLLRQARARKDSRQLFTVQLAIQVSNPAP
ncbi:prolyl oligopeptidase family serine peptidase [Nitrospira lenta]|nr:prolyl oligopeptidase family serine peptidase [Nitrospira lenta]